MLATSSDLDNVEVAERRDLVKGSAPSDTSNGFGKRFGRGSLVSVGFEGGF